MIKAILFDLDGTLANSLSDLANSSNYALNRLGFPTHETEEYKYFVGNGIPKLIERILPEDKKDEVTMKQCLNIFMEHYKEHYCDKTVPYSGISELLEKLKNIPDFKIAVVSNKEEGMARIVVNKLFGDIFDLVAGKREGYPAKPDPKLTLEVISELGVKTNECLFVGDSGMDVATAVNAGVLGIGVLWGFRTREELESNGADFIIENPNEIYGITEKLNGK